MSPRKRANNYILIVFDSCRYDSFITARPRAMRKFARAERRWSWASWTVPSHLNLLMGLMPHNSPRNIPTTEYYQREFLKFNERLNVKDMSFRSFLPRMYLPVTLRNLGYHTHALVSMPVLNAATVLNAGFDSWELMPQHNHMRAMLPRLRFDDDPSFWLLNTGETHYPYALPWEPREAWPKISGVHGVFEHLDDLVVGGKLPPTRRNRFSRKQLVALRERQIAAVRCLDTVIEELLDLVPRNTYVTITSDHGELFGEDGYFGHGPIQHDKVFEVPFLEGKVR